MARARALHLAVASLLLVASGAACAADEGSDVAGARPTSSTEPPAPSTTAAPPAFAAAVAELTAADLPSSWRPGCPHPVEQLRAIDVTHWGYDGEVHTGRVVVDVALAHGLVAVFRELYDLRYPIEKMRPIDAYDGSDDASTADNNTSAFNCRRATGGASWSEHAYGRAIDVNPLVNPYVRGQQVLPPDATPYVDRTRTDPGLLRPGDPAVEAFARHGWIWGGTWQTLKDYQHFSPSGR